MKRLIIFIIVIVLILLLWRGINMNLIKKGIKTDKLISIHYSNSGDMNGNTDSTTLDVDKLTITTRYRAIHSDPLEVKEYKITKKDIDNITNIINKYKIPELSKLEMGDLFAYDAPTKSLTLTYDNSSIGGSSYESYNINYYMKLSTKQKNQLNELTNYMFTLIKEENKIKEYKEK